MGRWSKRQERSKKIHSILSGHLGLFREYALVINVNFGGATKWTRRQPHDEKQIANPSHTKNRLFSIHTHV